MSHSKYICLLLLGNLAILPSSCFAKEQILNLSVPESLDINIDYTAHCLFKQILQSMGYQVNQVKHPLMRTITETQKGNMAMVLIGQPNFKTDIASKTIPHGIAITATPYLTTAVSFYAQKNANIIMDKTDWLTNYQLGLVRSTHTHDPRRSDPDNNKSSNYYFYVNTLSAFTALLRQRVDIVVATELEYLSAKAMLTLDDEIKNIASLGTAGVYPGFSHRYFGEEKAKALANRYDIESAQLSGLNRKQCNKEEQEQNRH